MGSFQKYLRNEFQVSMFSLEHETASDFYVSCWQRNRAILPLLCIKTVLFIGCLGILGASLVLTSIEMGFARWPIYMTHWGLVLITLATGFSLAVSFQAYLKGPLEASFGLPWYVKAYWGTYNVAITMAFFITVFYWTLLTGEDVFEVDFAVDPVLDIFIHGINSVLMMVLLIVSRHPARLLHFVYPLAVGLVYVAFSGIYYAAGGTDPFGNVWIYPMLDWSAPVPTIIMVIVSALGFIIFHLIVVALTILRDTITKRYRRDSKSLSISNIPYN